MPRKCLNCDDPFIGRTDKKFCSDQCRNTFNNKIKRQGEKVILDINKILRRNRSILKKFSPVGKTTVRTAYLVKMEFDFRFFTHTYITKNNNEYRFCYDFGYIKIDEEKTLIVHGQPYMNKE